MLCWKHSILLNIVASYAVMFRAVLGKSSAKCTAFNALNSLTAKEYKFI